MIFSNKVELAKITPKYKVKTTKLRYSERERGRRKERKSKVRHGKKFRKKGKTQTNKRRR